MNQIIPLTAARCISKMAISEGYLTRAVEHGWDPREYVLLPGDLDYLDDAFSLEDDEMSDLAEDVQRIVRSFLTQAISHIDGDII